MNKQDTPTRKIVMVVEDESPLLNLIRTRLQNRGFETICTSDVNEARVYLEAGAHCDLLWVDHFLSNGQSGLVLIEWIRQQKDLEELPIFVVSNNDSAIAAETYKKFNVARQYTKADSKLDEIINDIEEFFAQNN